MAANGVKDALLSLAHELRKRTEAQKPDKVRLGWETGNLSYKLRPVQVKMWDSLESHKALKKVINSSRRIGKTFTACVKACEKCLKKKGAQVRFAAPTGKQLRNIVFPIMRIICEDAPDRFRPRWSQVDGCYKFANGSELHMAGADNGHDEDLRGTAADLCIIEEAASVKRLKYLVDDILLPQLITTGGDLWMISTPPKSPDHEFLIYVQEAQLRGAYSEYDIHQSGYPKEVIAQFMEESGGAESSTWKREYLCQFVVDENYSIVPEWRDEFIQEVEKDEFFKFYHRFVFMDIGVVDLTVVLFAYYDFRRGFLVIEDEVVMNGPKMTTDRLAAEGKAKESELWGAKKPLLRISDNNDLLLLQDLSRLHDWHFAPTDKDTLEAMVNHLRLVVKGGKLRIHPRCKQTIGCMKYGVWDDDRKEFERSMSLGHFDALAALMYGVRNVDFSLNPIPGDYGSRGPNLYVPPGKEHGGLSSSGEALKRAFGLQGAMSGRR